MAIELTSQDIVNIDSRLEDTILESGYSAMYQYIYDKFSHQMPTQQRFWFEQAAQINLYLNNVARGRPNHGRTQSAYFIQQVNKESLKAAGKSSSDTKIKIISNTIGSNVYDDIIKSKIDVHGDGSEFKYFIPDMRYQVSADIAAAIRDGGLDLSEWGGAFYFWDMVIPHDIALHNSELAAYAGKKIGKVIVDDKKVDSFLDVTATAIVKTGTRKVIAFFLVPLLQYGRDSLRER